MKTPEFVRNFFNPEPSPIVLELGNTTVIIPNNVIENQSYNLESTPGFGLDVEQWKTILAGPTHQGSLQPVWIDANSPDLRFPPDFLRKK